MYLNHNFRKKIYAFIYNCKELRSFSFGTKASIKLNDPHQTFWHLIQHSLYHLFTSFEGL